MYVFVVLTDIIFVILGRKMSRKKFMTAEEAVLMIMEMSSDEEEPEIVVLPPENIGEITDEEGEDDQNEEMLMEVAGNVEVHAYGDEDIDDLYTIDETNSGGLEEPQRKKMKKMAGKKKYKWVKNCDKYSHQMVDTDIQSLAARFPLLKDKDPLDMFSLFYDDHILDRIVVESNRYAGQNGAHGFNLTKVELRAFLGILLLSGYHSLAREKLYWSRDEDVGVPIVSDKMPRNRFQEIKRYIHLADNASLDKNDKLAKVRPYLDHCKELLSQFGVFAKNVSIDEEMVPYYGRSAIKQYIRGKPIKFGMKLWVLASSDGFPFSFDVYTGKNDTGEGLLGERVVKKLIATMENPADHCLYTDNFFTSVSLLDYTKSCQLRHTGTVRSNRIGQCQVTDSKRFKNEERGELEYFGNGDSILVHWNDSKPVLVLSNFESVMPTKMVQRWSKKEKRVKEVPMPKMISSYNSYMGGVDILDRFMSDYRPRLRSKKWWWCLFANQLNMAVVAGWRVHKLVNGAMDHLAFRCVNFNVGHFI